MDRESILRLKVRLLTEGASLPESEWGGRTGGAGPVGARYFIMPNGRCVGVPVRRGTAASRFGSAKLEPTESPDVWIYDGAVRLRVVPRPRFYDGSTSDGVPYHKVAQLHGSSTLATTVYQSCRYWSRGMQCHFCTIPTSYRSGNTILEKRPSQFVQVLLSALDEGSVTDVLLTTGTPDSADVGITPLVDMIRAIREVSDIPIGVQFEPPRELSLIDSVVEAGANAIGIHIETADERLRARVCPGKYAYGPLDLYVSAWQRGVELLGRGNVSSFLLHGLGERNEQTLAMTRDLAQMGVMPVVVPFRPASGSILADATPSYVGNLDATLSLYKGVGRILFDNGLDPSRTLAGCHRCGACTPIGEAYDWAAGEG